MVVAEQRTLLHPFASGLPFMDLEGIKPGNKMGLLGRVEVIASPPIEIRGGEGSFFNTVYEEDEKVFVRTMMGRSDQHFKQWVYAREEVTEISSTDPNYEKAKRLLEEDTNGD